MPESNTYKLYKAYVENVKEFLVAEKTIKRLINRALKNGKTLDVKVLSKLYALLYSTYAEANFMKMILTPYGFEQSYIEEILKQKNIKEKWIKCLELAFKMLGSKDGGSEIPNKNKELINIINQYIVDPSIIRNKIAHGQIKIALNSELSNINEEISDEIGDLNVINISRWFEINKSLAMIVEDLIESKKAHYNYYYEKFQHLEYYIKKSSGWNIETKLKTVSMKKQIKHFSA